MFIKDNIKARIITYQSPWDKPDIYRWYITAWFFDINKSGTNIEGIDNDKGECFKLMPNPYQALLKEQCIENAINLLHKLGFK